MKKCKSLVAGPAVLLLLGLGVSAPSFAIEDGLPGAIQALAESVGGLTLGSERIVEVEAGLTSNTCGNPPQAQRFDTALLPDGTSVEFVIPENHVLIVTEVEVLGFGGSAGDEVQTRLFRGDGVRAKSVARRESISPNGRIFHIYDFNPGIVVPAGGEVCMNNNLGLTLTGFLRGYLQEQQ